MFKTDILSAKEAAWIVSNQDTIKKAKEDLNGLFDCIAFAAMGGRTYTEITYTVRALALVMCYELSKYGYQTELIRGSTEKGWTIGISWEEA